MKKLKYLLFFIPLLSFLNVNAAQYNHDVFTAQLYDNRSGSLYASSTSDTGAAYYGVLSLTGYGTGAAWGISSPTILLANHTYSLTANVSLGSSDIALSSINRIGLGSTLEDARVSYQNNTNAEELYSRVVGTDLVQFAFKSSINGSYIVFPFTSTSSTQTDIFLSYVNFEDLGEGGLSQTDITNSLNSQTTNITNNSNQNRDTILNNQNQNTQDIINNQNQTTENIINQGTASTYDSARNNFDTTDKNCGFLYIYSTKKGVAYYSNGSSYTNPNSFGTEEYISLQGATKLVLTDFGSTTTGQLIVYDSNKNYLDYWGVRDNTITLPNNAAYFRYATTIPTGHIFKDKGCTSKLDDMIEQNEQNTQDIINNQNSNTDREIESQQVCKTLVLDKNSISINDSYLDSVGYVVTNQWSTGWGITDFIEVTHVKKLNTYGSAPSLCFYNDLKSLISCSNNENLPVGDVSLPSGTKYIRASININQDKPQYNIQLCLNGNQALTDSITSEDNPNTNQDLNDMNNMVASDTPISDLITMPLTLINAYINGVNSSCSPINLGNLYGTDLILPCINLEQRLGSSLWHIIDAFFSIFMCYNIGMLFITAFDGITSLRDDFEGLYQPRHADTGYSPKHGG